MKTILFVACILVSTRSLRADDFKVGDSVTLTRDETIYVSQPYFGVVRKAKKGETFKVASYDKAAHKVFVQREMLIDGSYNFNPPDAPSGYFDPLGASSVWIKSDSVIGNTTTLGGFLGIKWGVSADAAKKILLAREGVTLDPKASTAEKLVFKGGTIADQKVEAINLLFAKNTFYLANVSFSVDSTKDVKKELLTLLTAKYGKRRFATVKFADANTNGEKWVFTNGESIYLADVGGETHLLYSSVDVEKLTEILSERDKGAAEVERRLKSFRTKDL